MWKVLGCHVFPFLIFKSCLPFLLSLRFPHVNHLLSVLSLIVFSCVLLPDCLNSPWSMLAQFTCSVSFFVLCSGFISALFLSCLLAIFLMLSFALLCYANVWHARPCEGFLVLFVNKFFFTKKKSISTPPYLS